MLGLPFLGLAHVEQESALVEECLRGAWAHVRRATDDAVSGADRDGETRGVPCVEPTLEVGHIREPGRAHDAGGDRRPVAALAVEDDGIRRVEVGEELGQQWQRDLACSLQHTLRRF